MGKRVFMKGNDAVAEAAIAAGCRAAFGYPITPSSEWLERMAWRMPQVGGVIKQLESEAAVSHALYGAGAVGIRAMTATAGPGLNWMCDAVAYCATVEVPVVIVDIMRGGPALGNIAPAQSDIRFVKGGANGDIRTIILAPSSIQEMADYTFDAFNLADKWRIPVLVMADGMLGQMKESLVLPDPITEIPEKPWRACGAKNRPINRFIPFALDAVVLEKINIKLNGKFNQIDKTEARWEEVNTENPDILVVAFGLVARIVKSVIKEAKKDGLEIGLLRPITIWPFPNQIIDRLTHPLTKVLVIEMNNGQIVDDVRLAVNGKSVVNFYGRAGGAISTAKEIRNVIEREVKS